MKNFFAVFPEITLYVQHTWKSPIYGKANETRAKEKLIFLFCLKQKTKQKKLALMPDW